MFPVFKPSSDSESSLSPLQDEGVSTEAMQLRNFLIKERAVKVVEAFIKPCMNRIINGNRDHISQMSILLRTTLRLNSINFQLGLIGLNPLVTSPQDLRAAAGIYMNSLQEACDSVSQALLSGSIDLKDDRKEELIKFMAALTEQLTSLKTICGEEVSTLSYSSSPDLINTEKIEVSTNNETPSENSDKKCECKDGAAIDCSCINCCQTGTLTLESVVSPEERKVLDKEGEERAKAIERPTLIFIGNSIPATPVSLYPNLDSFKRAYGIPFGQTVPRPISQPVQQIQTISKPLSTKFVESSVPKKRIILRRQNPLDKLKSRFSKLGIKSKNKPIRHRQGIPVVSSPNQYPVWQNVIPVSSLRRTGPGPYGQSANITITDISSRQIQTNLRTTRVHIKGRYSGKRKGMLNRHLADLRLHLKNKKQQRLRSKMRRLQVQRS